eukprot:29120-Pelagococcus_subviridis.AAC.35
MRLRRCDSRDRAGASVAPPARRFAPSNARLSVNPKPSAFVRSFVRSIRPSIDRSDDDARSSPSVPQPSLAGRVPGRAQSAARHDQRQDADGAEGTERPLLGGAVRTSARGHRSRRDDVGGERPERDTRRGDERQRQHVRIRGARPEEVRHEDRAVLLPAPRGHTRAVQDRRRAGVEDGVHAKLLVAAR